MDTGSRAQNGIHPCPCLIVPQQPVTYIPHGPSLPSRLEIPWRPFPSKVNRKTSSSSDRVNGRKVIRQSSNTQIFPDLICSNTLDLAGSRCKGRKNITAAIPARHDIHAARGYQRPCCVSLVPSLAITQTFIHFTWFLGLDCAKHTRLLRSLKKNMFDEDVNTDKDSRETTSQHRPMWRLRLGRLLSFALTAWGQHTQFSFGPKKYFKG